ncbi:MAG TPA: ribosome biogenesis GTP-binding protein YihA/YsxC [Nitrospiraceae bacterium]|nr:ribosome biogenesis GTP-binding protein YihA/YsxC [Nitrospiraceae bacterium]
MKILTAEFIKSCRVPEQFPADGLDEIAFVGRSNVGKSSLINSLLNRKSLAKVSKTPGKTQAVNFFLVTTADPVASRLYFVDLPGYGYAKVAKSVRAGWAPLIERYIVRRESLRGIVLLVESRVLAPQDVLTVEWLHALRRPLIVAVTKVDKLRGNERRGITERTRAALGVAPHVPIVPHSADTHEGRDGLWDAIRDRIRT